MLYLIGGAPRCGKTILARRLHAQTGVSYLPSDYVGMAIGEYIPASEQASRLPAVGRGLSNDERFRRFTPEDLTAGFHIRASTTWPGLARLLDYAHDERQDLIIEGFHLEPAFVHDLLTRLAPAQCRVGYLVKTNLAAITAGLQAATEARDWARERTTDPTTYPLIAAWVQQYSGWFQAEASRYGFPTFVTDDPFEPALAAALAYFQTGMLP